jgi:hypothetical protein
MSDIREIINVWNDMNKKNSNEVKDSTEGEIVTENTDGSYNVKFTEDNGVEYILQNRKPDGSNIAYAVGTRVLLTIPDGDLDRAVIRGNSNFTLPSSPTVKHFSTEPVTPVTGTIYLACPNENKIKQYSISGTVGADINTNWNAGWNIVAGATYLYCASLIAYVFFKIKPDGTEDTTIVSQTRYHNSHGLAIDNTEIYLYTAYDIWYETYGIAKINISTGEIEETELSELSGEITDICSDENYIYVLCRLNGQYYSSIITLNYSSEFVSETNIGKYYDLRIEKDENYFYVANSDGIDIFTPSFSLHASFTIQNYGYERIKTFAIKNNKIYVIIFNHLDVAVKIEIYNTDGTFESEFEIEGTVEDAVII